MQNSAALLEDDSAKLEKKQRSGPLQLWQQHDETETATEKA
jgi:hypothetical protein